MVTKRPFSFFRRHPITSVAHTYLLLVQKQLPRPKKSIENIFCHLIAVDHLLLTICWSARKQSSLKLQQVARGQFDERQLEEHNETATVHSSNILSHNKISLKLGLSNDFESSCPLFLWQVRNFRYLVAAESGEKSDSNGQSVIVASLQNDWRPAVLWVWSRGLQFQILWGYVWKFLGIGLGASWLQNFKLWGSSWPGKSLFCLKTSFERLLKAIDDAQRRHFFFQTPPVFVNTSIRCGCMQHRKLWTAPPARTAQLGWNCHWQSQPIGCLKS